MGGRHLACLLLALGRQAAVGRESGRRAARQQGLSRPSGQFFCKEMQLLLNTFQPLMHDG